ncbi:dynein heavy chain, cytoplasmic-like [Limulus polyphemus]|uniref:Dynein heavy chain, cytoplasmic-like n=1 Tax=Limulus polyphemus TaxID=6850 RepID=A0ABM1RXF3_LIMPO|nr:dynein heavy chain, cytoplasmic-like [Limulus polyphemus]
MEETDQVMTEVETVSQQYMPLSQACSSIYFTLEGLHQVHFLYQYSLHFFLDIYNDVLTNNPGLTGVTDSSTRLSIVTTDFYQTVYNRVTKGMLHQDRLVFALLLSKIHLRGVSSEPNFEHEFNHFLRGKEGILPGQPTIHVPGLSLDQLEGATALSRLPAFRNLQKKIDAVVMKRVENTVTCAEIKRVENTVTCAEIKRVENTVTCAAMSTVCNCFVHRWVMLKNVHLAPQWLVQLEKKLHTLQPHPAFRLFLTLEIHPKIPVNLLRAGRVFVFEPPPGIKANLLRTFSQVPAQRMMKAPGERARLYFLLAWFHAIVQERLRYSPLGWAKHYEFNESDLRVACDTLDTWIETVAMGRANLPPEKVPWNALCTLFGQCIYGGKIDNDFDQVTISVNFSINLGFGSDLISKLLRMQLLEDDDEVVYTADDQEVNKKEADGRPAWMRTLYNSACTWLRLVPQSLQTLRRTVENIKDPLYRYFEREVNAGARLLQVVRRDLEDVILICKGEKKQTNYHRNILSELAKGMLPSHWRKYTVPPECTVIQWITDFSDRIKLLQKISAASTTGGAAALKVGLEV